MKKMIWIVSFILLAGFIVYALYLNGVFESRLISAIKEKNISKIKEELNSGADINSRTSGGRTLLMMSAITGNVDITSLILEKRPDLNAKDNDGLTALMHASKIGNADIVRLLIQKGADIKIKDNSGKDAITLAEINNHKKVVNYLNIALKVNESIAPALANAQSNSGVASGVISATSENQTTQNNVVQSNPSRNNNGSNFLNNSRREITQQSLGRISQTQNSGANKIKRKVQVAQGASGSSISSSTQRNQSNSSSNNSQVSQNNQSNLERTNSGQSNSRATGNNSNSSVITPSSTWLVTPSTLPGANSSREDREILNYKKLGQELIAAAGTGETAIVRKLLQAGVDANTKAKEGMSVLMMAAAYGYVDVVRLLIQHGADVNYRHINCGVCSSVPLSALDLAKENGHNEIVRMLREAGAR